MRYYDSEHNKTVAAAATIYMLDGSINVKNFIFNCVSNRNRTQLIVKHPIQWAF
jgi:hypothetical protein